MAVPQVVVPPVVTADPAEAEARVAARKRTRDAFVALGFFSVLSAALLGAFFADPIPDAVAGQWFLAPVPFLLSRAAWRFVAGDSTRFERLLAANLLKAAGVAASLVAAVWLLDLPPLRFGGGAPLGFLATAGAAWGLGGMVLGAYVYDQYRLAFRFNRDPLAGVFALVGVGLLLGGALLLFPALAPAIPYGDRLVYTLPVALGVLLATPLIHYLGRKDVPYVSAACVVIGGSASRNLALALPLATYLAYRSTLEGTVRHLVLYEWALGLALLSFILHRAKSLLKQAAQDEPTTSRAKRHVQVVSPLYEPRFANWDRAIQAFVDRGEGRDRYETLWVEALRASGLKDLDVNRELAPLLEYRDLKSGWLPLPGRKKRVAAKNRQRRLEIHRTLVSRFTAPTLRKGRHHG
ncbi:MAG TPA: hypothetical protein VNZ52_16645 [Candidatus Thermoplasmatota archaeon]|nr:hypothetical protein [Candidatus Thermoplasmatota archaeon]